MSPRIFLTETRFLIVKTNYEKNRYNQFLWSKIKSIFGSNYFSIADITDLKYGEKSSIHLKWKCDLDVPPVTSDQYVNVLLN